MGQLLGSSFQEVYRGIEGYPCLTDALGVGGGKNFAFADKFGNLTGQIIGDNPAFSVESGLSHRQYCSRRAAGTAKHIVEFLAVLGEQLRR